MSRWLAPLWSSLALFCLITAQCAAEDTIKDPATGKTFPATVSFQVDGKDTSLQATGISVRKKFFVKVYSVAHYMENPASVKEGNIYENILNSNQPKELLSIWVRNADQKKVVDGYRESFGKVLSSDDLAKLKPEIDNYLSFFGDVKTNDKHVLRWMPDGTITVEINDTLKGEIKNPAFAKALWSIWFGQKSVVSRDQLVARIK